MFKFFINDTELIDQPIGWKDFSAKIEFNKEDRTLLASYPNTLTFWGDGWELIKAQRDTDICSLLDFRIEKKCASGVYETLTTGIINISACKFNRTKCTVETEIEDDGIFTLIKSNWGIKFHMTADRSKNDVEITPPPAFSLDVFNPASAGSAEYVSVSPASFFQGGLRRSYDVKDVLEFLIKAMSDDKLSLQSDWYDNLPITNRFCIVRGKELRLGSSIPSDDYLSMPDVDFKSLFISMAKAYNLVMYTVGSVVRIETLDYIREQSSALILENVKDVEESYDQTSIYSKIIFGSKEFNKDGLYPQFRQFVTHKPEEYHFLGVCNIDSPLDLSNNDYIWDTNTIEKVLITDVGTTEDTIGSDFHDDNFIIQYDGTPSGGYKAIKVSLVTQTSNGPYQYNRLLMNDQISIRYSLQSAISKVIKTSALDIAFKADISSDIVFGPIQQPPGGPPSVVIRKCNFDDDFTPPNGDPSNSYGNNTVQGSPITEPNSLYTASFEGDYTFEYNIDFTRSGYVSPFNTDSVTISFVKLDASLNEIDRQSIEFDDVGYNVDLPYGYPFSVFREYNSTQSYSTYMNLNDIVYVELNITNNIDFVRGAQPGFPQSFFPENRTYTIKSGSVFNTISTPVFTQILKTYEEVEYDFVLHNFEKNISNDDIKLMLNNTSELITVTDPLGTINGYMDSVTINLNTGNADFQLRSRDSLIL